MAKIIKVGSQNLTPNKIANPFKTSRNSTTNPFKYNNFDGNTLPFELAADVFETKSSSKMKIIASSVTGSMNKMKSLLPESIINFVNRVREGISSAWDYAKNTNVSDIPAVRAFNDVMNTPINIPALDGLTTSMSSLGKDLTANLQTVGRGISSSMEFLNTDVTDIGRAMADRWTTLISSIKPNRISADMPVAELEQLWRNEIELGGAAA